MAKIKVKKESVLKLRFTEHSGQEWELWENFCRDLCDLFEALAFKGFRLNVAAKSQGLIWIHQGTAEKALDKEIIKKLTQKHKIEIEFEEEKEKKEEKWIPVHELAIELIEKFPATYVSMFSHLYALFVKVPKEAIPGLLDLFERQLKDKEMLDEGVCTNIEQTIANLKQQQKEEKEKE